jgi:hypothetical protein
MNTGKSMVLYPRFAIPLLLVVVQGCSGSRDASGPTPIDLSHAAIAVANHVSIFGLAGTEIIDPPAVRIANVPDGQPIAGVTVTFIVNGKQSAAFTAITGSDGIARLDSLRLDTTPGEYGIFARANGLASVAFVEMALSKPPVAVYDLQSIGPVPIPRTYSAGGISWTITGGQYVLFDDGTYIFGYETNKAPAFDPTERFIRRDPQTVDFYAVQSDAPPPPGFPDPGYLYSTGTVSGNTLMVRYANGQDEDEVYVRR